MAVKRAVSDVLHYEELSNGTTSLSTVILHRPVSLLYEQLSFAFRRKPRPFMSCRKRNPLIATRPKRGSWVFTSSPEQFTPAFRFVPNSSEDSPARFIYRKWIFLLFHKQWTQTNIFVIHWSWCYIIMILHGPWMVNMFLRIGCFHSSLIG